MSQEDLDLRLNIVNLPQIINQMITMDHYAMATKQICLYHKRTLKYSKTLPKLIKLVHKEIIGVLQ